MSEKNDKDSYARDTLQFAVPRQQRPQGQRPQGQRTQGQRSQGQYPRGQYSQGQQRPQGQRPQGQYPQGQQHPQGQRPQGQRPQGQRPQGQRPQGQRPQGQRPQGQRPQAQRPQGQRPQQRPQQHPQPQQRPVQSNTPKVRKKRGGLLRKILFGLLIFLVVIFVIYSVLALLLISKVQKDETGERSAPSHSVYDRSSVRNILLIGNDSRGEDRGRSDSMILLSINSSTNDINMVSLMRDTYVQIPGYGGDKLNAAYSYGGPELLMDTIEENFYINVDDYISVNFTCFADIVNAVGGVEIEVNDDEAAAINVLLDSKEGVSLFGEPKDSDYLDGGGKYVLNGKQALCYSRLRKVGNADFERTERQRKVLKGILGNMGPSSLFSIIGSALPDLHSNMSTWDMYLLSLRLPLLLGFYDIAQERIPREGTYWASDIDGQSVLEIDFDANIDFVEEKLYAE